MSIGLLRIISRKKITKKGLAVDGIVSAVNTDMFRNRITFHTVICFKTLEGKDIEVSLDVGMPVPIHTIGNKIKLLYNRDNPEEIVLVSKVVVILEYFISILGAIGLSFFMIMFLKT